MSDKNVEARLSALEGIVHGSAATVDNMARAVEKMANSLDKIADAITSDAYRAITKPKE